MPSQIMVGAPYRDHGFKAAGVPGVGELFALTFSLAAQFDSAPESALAISPADRVGSEQNGTCNAQQHDKARRPGVFLDGQPNCPPELPADAENIPFTAAHSVDAMNWKNLGWPVAHAVAVAWHAIKAGESLTVLSLEPEPYAGTGITPLHPTCPNSTTGCTSSAPMGRTDHVRIEHVVRTWSADGRAVAR
ncbi:hypothetical protein ACWCXX_40910 [Streptomyces sp. NPDC001732]